MDPNFFQSRFSTHFNRLSYLGMWPLDVQQNAVVRVLFLLYRVFVTSLLLAGCVLQMYDLYVVFGNLRKVTYNMCTSVIVIGLVIKILLLTVRKNDLTALRFSLWHDSVKLDSVEAVAVQDLAYAQLRVMRVCFYAAATIFLPIWIVSSYFSYKWGPRQLAFAGYIPLGDPLDDHVYVPALAYQAVSAVFIIFPVIEADLAMFSLVLQMEAYYQILIENILKLNEIYGDETAGGEGGGEWAQEVNPGLKNENGKRALKVLIIRHLEIIEYSKSFERIYSPCMILQMVTGALLIVMNGLELSMYLQEMSVKIYFQSGYAILIGVDIYFVCYHLSRLSAESFNVGTAVYSTVWYKMNTEMRRGLGMMILRSQNPPRITAGKLFLVDLSAYLHANYAEHLQLADVISTVGNDLEVTAETTTRNTLPPAKEKPSCRTLSFLQLLYSPVVGCLKSGCCIVDSLKIFQR